MRNIFLIIILLFSSQVSAQTEFKIMFYNLLRYPSAPPVDRNKILQDILNSYEPDLFLVCELEDENGANTILNTSLSQINKNYAKTPYVSNQSSTRSILEQLVYYNTDYFVLDNQQEINTGLRDINHYTFILKTGDYLTNPTYLEVFVAHLKASQGVDNERERLYMMEQFTAALDNLAPNSFVVFGGDFNLYTSTEPAYHELLDINNSIVFKDVQNLNNVSQNWHVNSTYINLFTQSTRISNFNFDGEGAGGGFDDRFDFIVLSDNLLATSDIQYKPNSYQSYGNNSNVNCLNGRIDSDACSGALYDQTLRTNLYNMSDHLPVVLELEFNQTLSISEVFVDEKLIEFPKGNFVKDELFIKVSQELINKELIVLNILGQTVVSKKIHTTEFTINTDHLENQIYFISVDGINEVKKFVKSN